MADRVEVVAFREHPASEDELVAAVQDFDVVVTQRERIAFPAPAFPRLLATPRRSAYWADA
ncbi:hypothetical protein [Kitasatospora purpeofusca]|uniref:hypothetical protein n=1 Tax=Kitasatospora purpeofusca TaxID=67352 RepID=UPI0036D36065